MPEYKKVGYLTTDFKMFHLKDEEMRTFHYHYHDFHKILILLNGDVTYCIEGRSYDLKKNDIVLVHAGEVHKPVIHSDAVYDRIIIYVSPDFLTTYRDSDSDLSLCFQKAYEEKSHVLRVHSFGNSRLGAVTKDLDASLSDSDFAHELHHKLLFLEFLIQLNRAALHNKIEFIETSASSEKILSMPFDKWPYFPSYGAYFRNVGSVLLDNVSFTTIGPDTRPDVYTDNVRSLVR